ncbi:glycosyltransferase [Empedobacter brevis]|uniref:glycosyltransferase n=1 Tax=Empedobacter brevis TaxID=247 RepID=UPI0039B0FA74
MKILCLTQGGKESPSANFRIRQYKDLFKKDGWSISEFKLKNLYYPQFSRNIYIHYLIKLLGIYYVFKKISKLKLNKKIHNSDIIWINKYAIKLVELHKYKNKIIIQDIDDAVFYNASDNFNYTLNYANHLLVGNNFLAQEIEKIKKVNYDVISTAIDLDSYPKKQSFGDKFIIGWIGSPYTNKYLIEIKDSINQFLTEYDSELYIISDRFEDFKGVFTKNCKLIKWEENNYIENLNKITVGLMPLSNSNWEKGKCSFKMLQYMACFKPVLVSPVGMNKEILEKYDCGISANNAKDWYNNLLTLYKDKNLSENLGKNGRLAIEDEYSVESNYKKIKQIFENYGKS